MIIILGHFFPISDFTQTNMLCILDCYITSKHLDILVNCCKKINNFGCDGLSANVQNLIEGDKKNG